VSQSPHEVGLDLTVTDPWILGPTDSRPPEQWLPEVVELLLETFQPPAEEREGWIDYLARMMARIAQVDDDMLHYRVFRWEDPEVAPVVASFGLAERPADDELDELLTVTDLRLVEPPVVEEVGGPEVRRALSYSTPEGGGPVYVELKYVVDRGHPDVLAMIQAGLRDPRDLATVIPQLDEMATSMRLVGA